MPSLFSTLLGLALSLALAPSVVMGTSWANKPDTGASWYISYNDYSPYNGEVCHPFLINWRAPLNETANAHLIKTTKKGWRTVETYKNLKRMSLNSKNDVHFFAKQKSYFTNTKKNLQWGTFVTNVTMNGHSPEIYSLNKVQLVLDVPGGTPVTTNAGYLSYQFTHGNDESYGMWHYSSNCTLVYDIEPDQ
ncbi:hypothetical protein T439DRAFT_327667 [Meredithblackwellia eburnea MCA 4105]